MYTRQAELEHESERYKQAAPTLQRYGDYLRRKQQTTSVTGSLSDHMSALSVNSGMASGDIRESVPSFDGEIFSDALHYLAYKFVIIKLNRDRKTYRKYDLILELDRFIREESYLSTTHNVTAEKMFQHMRDKRLFLFNKKKGRARMLPLTVYGDSTNMVVFSVKSATNQLHFVCQICDRGFPTFNGLSQHVTHPIHSKQETALISKIRKVNVNFTCPLNGCDFKASSREEVARHIQSGKIVEVDHSPGMFEMKQTTTPLFSTCEVCMIRVLDDRMRKHEESATHTRNEKAARYQQEREQLMENKGGLEVVELTEEEGDGDMLILEDDRKGSKSIVYRISNTTDTTINLYRSSLYQDIPAVTVSFSNNLLICRIEPYGSVEHTVTIETTNSGQFTIPIKFRASGGTTILKEKRLTCICRSDLEMYKELQPKVPYDPKSKRQSARSGQERDLQIVESDLLPEFESGSRLEMTLPLEKYFIPMTVKFWVRFHSDQDEIMKNLNITDLDYSNYSQFFNNLLYVEELQMKRDIERYAMPRAEMIKDTSKGLLRLKVPGLAENRPSVLRGDKLYAIPVTGDRKRYQGIVHHVGQQEVKLGFHTRMRDKFFTGMVHRIEFTINRLPMKVEHRAVTWAGESDHSLKKVLFPVESQAIRLPSLPSRLIFYDRHLETNPEQKIAVEKIVRGTSKPAPYLIFGPPGTGKTVTMVEAIKQVCKNIPEAKVLACAPQNDAADLITRRLIKNGVDEKDIIRLHALSRSRSAVSEKILRVSNFDRDGAVVFPSKEELEQKRVIVVTLVTSGRLVSAEMGKHFTHIFIDEAGHATEPETVIPLAGLLDVNMRNGGQVVLAGDPKQLGPIIRSGLAKAGGLGLSLLERLMNDNLYTKDPDDGTYNQDYVTKLVNSFRSHPDILKIPNELFYDDELQVCADEMDRERFCQWEGLPRKGFPLIFYGETGAEMQEDNSPSFYNIHEIARVKHYLQDLMDIRSPRVKAEDIGIISPYHKQVTKLNDELKRMQMGDQSLVNRYKGIMVGSVEKFQGQERPIIIISTVRSQDAYLTHDKDFNLGFVGNPKRFNVAVTRTKALLIVIGNPAILCTDENWRKLIQYIHKNGGYKGCPPPDNLYSEDDIRPGGAGPGAAARMIPPEDESEFQAMIDPGMTRKDA